MFGHLPRRGFGPNYNRGAQLLALALQARGLSQNRANKLLGTASGMMARWLYGDRRPSLAMAVRCLELFGIPVEAWHQPANDVEPALAATGTEG